MSESRDTLGRFTPPGRQALRLVAVVVVLVIVGFAAFYWNMVLIEVAHAPSRYARRSGDLSANVTGWMPRFLVRDAWFRVNDAPPMPVGQGWPRDRPPNFTVEIPADSMRPGENTLEIEARGWFRPPTTVTHTFTYDPAPIELPLEIDWATAELDVQDGEWERVEVGGETRVRPRPGKEGYDRMLLATGSFPVDRRIEGTVTFRHDTIARFHKGAREFGFGILSLWGGHPDDWAYRPRAGWSFALSWYWSKPGGAGNEISYRHGVDEPRWQGSYRDFDVEPGVTYAIVVEVRRVRDERGFDYFSQRTKWWPKGSAEPERWLILDDRGSAQLPHGEYAVALLAFNAQAEFGPLRILPLP